MTLVLQTIKCWRSSCHLVSRRCMQNVSYIQGQTPEANIREYFYYIDHEGMLFLDDAKMKNFTSCFKERKFLKFFFSRIKLNDSERYYNEFPYISLCGRERNFIRCDDTPIVFTHIIQGKMGRDNLSYAHAGNQLLVPFEPHKTYVSPTTGRLYHPAWPQVGNIGLICSKLAIELSRNFEFTNGESKSPTHFIWRNERLKLQNEWIVDTVKHSLCSKELQIKNA